jgi:osmotically-inducible protein OsmY
MAPGDLFLTTRVIGASVKGTAGEEIGSVSDVVTDASSGRIRFGVIEMQGTDRLVAVPWEAITFRPGERAAVLGVSAEKVAAGPGFTRDAWPRVTGSRWDAEAYAHYGYRPSWEVSRTQVSAAGAARHRYIAPLAVGVLLLVFSAGFGYLVYRQGWSTTSAQVHDVVAAVRETTNAVRETSADVAATAKVKAALALSKRVSAFQVNVDTQDAVATLTGSVPSVDVRELAGEIAGDTSGVRKVRNLLTVDPGARPDRDRERLAQRVEELEQQTAITEILQEHPEMEGSKIKVRVAGGVVTLDGTVVSDAQKSRAEQIVSSFAGVREVRNHIR